MNKKIELKLPSADDLFTTQEQRDDEKREKIIDIPLDELYPFKAHPFQVIDNEELRNLAISIMENGVLVPALARPREDGGYELLSGHRRRAASLMARKETLPVIVRDIDDDTAIVVMVDSNNQRENLLPSEKAFAYKMKLEAIKRQGSRGDLTSGQVDPKLIGVRSNVKIADESGESVKQIQRYIRLTNLIKPLLDMVDKKEIAFNPAVEISYLSEEVQELLLEAMMAEQCTPSLSQAVRLKNASKENDITADTIFEIVSEQKANQRAKISFQIEKIKEYFPKTYTSEQMERKILRLLEDERKRQKAIRQNDKSKDRNRGEER